MADKFTFPPTRRIGTLVFGEISAGTVPTCFPDVELIAPDSAEAG
jgi:hypothetical protein